MMKKSVLGMQVLLVAIMGVVGQAAIIDDDFNGTSIDSSVWTSSGNATVDSSYLKVNTGGYVQSLASVSVKDGAVDITFTGVGTENWNTYNMWMGLCSADGSQYIIIDQPGYANCSVVHNATESLYARLAWAPWGQAGPELRSGETQTWQLVLTEDSLDLYVNGTRTLFLSEADGTLPSGSIPTTDLYVKFQGNTGNFIMDRITTVPEPATLGLLILGVAGLIRRKQ